MKRRGNHRDHVLNQVADSFDTEVFATGFARILEELTDEQAFVLRLAASGLSFAEIADHTRMPLKHVRFRFRMALRKLRGYAARGLEDPVFRDFLFEITTEDADLSRTLANLTRPVVARRGLDPEWCERHQSWTHNWVGSLACEMCPCPCPTRDGRLLVKGGALIAGAGRPRKYCSSACRQAAYRARQHTRSIVGDDTGNSGGPEPSTS
ncbi:hypothetical protein [Nocardia tengchongensis]|uniref:hypothetical protein n=1 Tax=Nocardia tengchongensis TaxID=2055889 RepID=UPI00367C2803